MREARRTMARHDPDSPVLSLPVADAEKGVPPPTAEPELPALKVARTDDATEPSAMFSIAQRTVTARNISVVGPDAIISESAPTPAAPAALAMPTAKPKMARVRARSERVAGPSYAIETEKLERGARWVAGVDEAGRGPLAGPVVAAAVILDLAALPVGLDDSKKLTAADRERLFEEIVASAFVSVASASALEIDRWNIRQATLLAMTRALAGLERAPCHAIVDGRDVPLAWATRGTAVIEGDARALSIAAASIIAKVTRDRMMQRLCAAFPAYGFSRHMGYATAEHRLALDRHGPCPYHRMTFSPIRQGVLDFG